MPSFMKIFIISLGILIVAHESLQFLSFGGNKDKSKSPENEDKETDKEKNNNNNFFFTLAQGQKQNKTDNRNEEAENENPEDQQAPPVPERKRKSKKHKNKDKKSSSAEPQKATAAPLLNLPLEVPVVQGPACEKKSDELLMKIRELRAAIEKKIPETSDLVNYAKDDNYLFRWLVAAELDVKKCETMILNHIKWRDDHRLDEIENEDYGEINDNYHIELDGEDKHGRPVMEWWLHDWDIGAALEKKGVGVPKLARWLVRSLELVTKDLYEMNIEKKFCVTQAILLADVHELDEKKHGCPQCWQVYAIWAQYFETHYPNLFLNLHFMQANNTVFVQAIKVMAGAMKQQQRTLMPFKTWTDEKSGLDAIGERIPPEQRSPKFGGTMKPSKS